ncbi:TcpD family membrane protein, partial [Streptococcus suis]
DGSFGKAVTKLAIGVAAYYYGSNPQQVMDSLKGVVAKIFG